MKRKPQLTKKERKALKGPGPGAPQGQHIHCIACGIHLDPAQFDAPASAAVIRCQHGTQFASCTRCVESSKRLLEEHDRTGQAVKSASAWH
jgi:hypothetical protein